MEEQQKFTRSSKRRWEGRSDTPEKVTCDGCLGRAGGPADSAMPLRQKLSGEGALEQGPDGSWGTGRRSSGGG